MGVDSGQAAQRLVKRFAIRMFGGFDENQQLAELTGALGQRQAYALRER